jgi:hypothetical protein
MRYLICTALACLLYLGSALPAEKPGPQLSKEPLTDEQVAIYREALQNYVKDLKDMQPNLVNKTVPLDHSYNGCSHRLDYGGHFAIRKQREFSSILRCPLRVRHDGSDNLGCPWDIPPRFVPVLGYLKCPEIPVTDGVIGKP